MRRLGRVGRTLVGAAAAAAGGVGIVAVVALADALPASGLGLVAVTASTGSTSSVGFDLAAARSTFTGFAYAGPVTVSTPTGDVRAMDITASAATFVDLGIVVPCTALPGLGTGMTSITSTRAGATTKAAAGIELYLTTLTVTTGGTATTFTPDAPPPSLGDVTVDSVTGHGQWAAMPSLAAPGLAQHSAYCSP